MKIEKAYAIKDESGHWYIIPSSLKDEFLKDEEQGEADEWQTFNEKYSKYMTRGDINLIQLYAEF